MEKGKGVPFSLFVFFWGGRRDKEGVITASCSSEDCVACHCAWPVLDIEAPSADTGTLPLEWSRPTGREGGC